MSGLATGHMSPNWTSPRVTIDSRLEHQGKPRFHTESRLYRLETNVLAVNHASGCRRDGRMEIC
jgi:hypothetical protein